MFHNEKEKERDRTPNRSTNTSSNKINNNISNNYNSNNNNNKFIMMLNIGYKNSQHDFRVYKGENVNDLVTKILTRFKLKKSTSEKVVRN